jgi:ATP-dependent DNA ligase
MPLTHGLLPAESRIVYYAFDFMVHQGRNLTGLPLAKRGSILRSIFRANEHVALSEVWDGTAEEMLVFIRNHSLGVIGKQTNSAYQPGQRTGLWAKYRINLGQEFVVGGYVASHLGVDALVVGFYRGRDLIYAARVRAGLVPATRREMFNRLQPFKTSKCPFVNLPARLLGVGIKDSQRRRCRSASGYALNWLLRSIFWNRRGPITYGIRNSWGSGTTKIP